MSWVERAHIELGTLSNEGLVILGHMSLIPPLANCTPGPRLPFKHVCFCTSIRGSGGRWIETRSGTINSRLPFRFRPAGRGSRSAFSPTRTLASFALRLVAVIAASTVQLGLGSLLIAVNEIPVNGLFHTIFRTLALPRFIPQRSPTMITLGISDAHIKSCA